nr:fimbria/pilus periplasmic chaperone [Escherichia coli]UGK56294.1 hypothetical protein [Escherichia coli]UGK56691.1 hypothetical protein [Escherichia coli]
MAESAGNSAGGGQSEKNEGQNVLQLAIRSRFKFIYRPAGLGNRDAAAEKLTLTASGSSLAINNPTPFYITVSRISRDGGKALNSKNRDAGAAVQPDGGALLRRQPRRNPDR